MRHDLTQLSALQAAAAIRAGQLHAEALVEAHLARIEETEPVLCAWAHLDPQAALDQAREADRIRRAGRATGALHGVPVGLKDIVDTADMPTECGSAVFAGRRPGADARLVERLREAGAVIMGKTRTTELAYLRPTVTTNPQDRTRSPGGSSSGSAAAVAARHVPLAVGTQTGGSVIRPASFCGVYGIKPSAGIVSRSGVMQTSATLDQVGGFANTLEDAALLIDAIGGYDPRDAASFPRPRPGLLAGAQSPVPVPPDIAWFDMPWHDRLDPDAAEGLEAVLEALGARVERFAVAPQLAELAQVHRIIYDHEIAAAMAALPDGAEIGPELTQAIARGRAITAAQYQDALAVRASAQEFFARHFNDFDAILAPAATGEAPPLSANTTGDAVFCLPWTLAGLPCLSLPLLVGETGLPVGVQLIGAAEEDDRLMRTAAWMQTTLAGAGTEEE